MSAPLVWVVGAGGLLGSALAGVIGDAAFRFAIPFAWDDRVSVREQMREAVRVFGQRSAAEPNRPWAIAWCAGAGVVATSAAALEAEVETFRYFLDLLGSDERLSAGQGNVLLASSAGGVYGASFDSPITESTPVAIGSAYGRCKLMQEELLLAWASTRPRAVNTLIARIANLYGPAQRLSKPQGLISYLSRCLIHRSPAHIYVSLDTIRDYLFAEDAGRRLARGLQRLTQLATAEELHVTKLYASEREVSIAGLLGIFRQIARRRLRVISGLHAVAALQPRRLQFRSQTWADDTGRQTELIDGVNRVYRHQLQLFRQGQLSPPPIAMSRR